MQNTPARLIFELRTGEHVTARVALAAGPLAGLVQAVLSHALSLLREVPGLSRQRRESRRHGRPGRSSSSSDFSLPRLRTKFGERAFTYTSPSAWNSLPKDLRAVTDPGFFRKLLKTHFFSLAFCVCDNTDDSVLCNAPMTYNCIVIGAL